MYLGHTNVSRKVRRSAVLVADEAEEEEEDEALTPRASRYSCIMSGMTQLGEAHCAVGEQVITIWFYISGALHLMK